MGARRPDSRGRRVHACAARRRVDVDHGATVKRVTLASAMGLSALFVTLSLAGLFGSVGEAFDVIFTGLIGVAAWGLVLTLGYSSAVIACGKSFSAFRAFGDLVIIVVASAFAHLISSEAGGVVGEAVGDAGVSAFSLAGTFIMGLSVIGLVVAERIKMLSLLSRLAEAILSATSEPSFPYEAYSEPLAKPIHLPVRVRVVTPSEVPETRECIYEPMIESSAHEAPSAVANVIVASQVEAAFVTDDTMPVVEEQPKSASVASVVRAARASSVVVKFALPSTKLLSKGEAGKGVNEVQLQEEGELLVSTLASYNVKAKLEEIVVGPSVVTFEASIAVGTKLRTVMGLSDDIALAFGSRKVRIVPSRLGRVAFEIAHEVRAAVGLRELIEDTAFASTTGLPVILGRGMRGECVAMNLAEAPHALVAGATGSGKSVGLNAMLISLLMRCSPDDLRMICIDPKQVELAVYSRLPHMLAPIISDPKEAVVALKWAVSEMERRYELLSKAGVKNIAAFNSKVGGEKLSLILVVIDEYADLYAIAGKEVEGLVARLAQKSRAAGLHVVLATQRPSVDVLSGVIKANFPMRVAFRTAQKNDGRVILDESGSEALLGRGDMLARLNGVDALVRVQGPMVSEAEIEAVVGHWCNQSMPRYDASVLTGDPEVEDGKSVKARKDAAVKVWS